jgi:transposase
MSKKTTLISQELADNADACLKELGYIGQISNRLQAIKAAHKHGITKVAEVFDISRSTIHRWVLLFQGRGVSGLSNRGKPSRSKLNTEQKAQIKLWVEAKPTVTLKELSARIFKEMSLQIGKSSVHRSMLELGFAHITGRKRHHKSDEAKQDEFKKNYKQ